MAGAERSDLPVRLASALVMLALAGGALWLGNPVWGIFALIVAGLCFNELVQLAGKAFETRAQRFAMILFGAVYIALAALALIGLPRGVVLGILGLVIATDVGAYFTGRAIGGPKIAPRISPSKTWAGLGGGALLAGLFSSATFVWNTGALVMRPMLFIAFAIGAVLAVIAQGGDFFESWLKRRAKVKDSSRLIPGHGGVFDRIDGLIAVAIVAAPLWMLHP